MTSPVGGAESKPSDRELAAVCSWPPLLETNTSATMTLNESSHFNFQQLYFINRLGLLTWPYKDNLVYILRKNANSKFIY